MGSTTEEFGSTRRKRGACQPSRVSVASASNLQESYYDDTVDYRSGSPHLMHQPLHDRLVNVILREVNAIRDRGLPLDVVEVGAGHGGFTEPMLAAGCRVTTLEMSQASINRLQERFGTSPLLTSVYNPTGDFDCIAAREFSLAACVSVLHHIPDYSSAVSELIRRVRPGGSLIALQDPLWYPSVSRATRGVSLLGYMSWRVQQGSRRRAFATASRRLRGVYDEGDPADMVEYHVVRNGVDQDHLVRLLLEHFNDVRLIRYWSNNSRTYQRVGERLGLLNTFGLVASGRHD